MLNPIANVKNCFTKIGLTNCAREVSRMVEQPFGATISRTERNGKSRYGRRVVWIDYSCDIKGIIKKKLKDHVIIYWENGRILRYNPDREYVEIKLDIEYYRNIKLEDLEI